MDGKSDLSRAALLALLPSTLWGRALEFFTLFREKRVKRRTLNHQARKALDWLRVGLR